MVGACQACTVAIFMSCLYRGLLSLVFGKVKHSLTEVMWLTPPIKNIPRESGEDLKSNYTYLYLLCLHLSIKIKINDFDN